MRVNVRPATKFRWNSGSQRREEPKKPLTISDERAIDGSSENFGTVQSACLLPHTNQANSERQEIARSYNQSSISPAEIAFEDRPDLPKSNLGATSSSNTSESTPVTVKFTEADRSDHCAIANSNLQSVSVERVLKIDGTLRNIAKGSDIMEQPVNNPIGDDKFFDGAQDEGDNTPWQKIVWQLMPETPVGRALVSATQRLESSGIDTAALDAQVILAHILGKDRAWLFAHHEYLLSEEEAEQFTDCVARRMAFEPVAYLIGQKEFYGLNFAVDHRVLIPRPETELLVDLVLNHLELRADEMPIGHQLCLADVGTGCGAIAISVATNVPDVRVYATDISLGALEIARTNIQRLDKRCQVSLMQGDLLDPLRNKVDMPKVDMIVANLPYINSNDYAGLAPDVRKFEPQLALEAGPQGLDAIARLLEQAPAFLNPKGIIMLEIGYDQGEAVVNLANQLIPDALGVELRQDYNGRDRLVTISF